MALHVQQDMDVSTEAPDTEDICPTQQKVAIKIKPERTFKTKN